MAQQSAMDAAGFAVTGEKGQGMVIFIKAYIYIYVMSITDHHLCGDTEAYE